LTFLIDMITPQKKKWIPNAVFETIGAFNIGGVLVCVLHLLFMISVVNSKGLNYPMNSNE
jgi:hypothetical protein